MEVATVLSFCKILCGSLTPYHDELQYYGHLNPTTVFIEAEGGISIKPAPEYLLSFESIEEISKFQSLEVACIPPEVWIHNSWTHHSDIFALGVISYFMLTGRLPFVADSNQHMIDRMINEEPAPPIKYNKSIPLWFNTLIMRMIQRDTSERILSTAEIASIIEQRFGDVLPSLSTEHRTQTVFDSTWGKKSPGNFSFHEFLGPVITALTLASFSLLLLVASSWVSKAIDQAPVSGLFSTITIWIPLIILITPATTIPILIILATQKNTYRIFKSWIVNNILNAIVITFIYLANIGITYFLSTPVVRVNFDFAAVKTVFVYTLVQVFHATLLSPICVTMSVDNATSVLILKPLYVSIIPLYSSYLWLVLLMLTCFLYSLIIGKVKDSKQTRSLFESLSYLTFIPLGFELVMLFILEKWQIINFIRLSKVPLYSSTAYISDTGIVLGILNLILLATSPVLIYLQSIVTKKK